MSQSLKSKQASRQTKNLECSVTYPESSGADLKLLFPFLKQRNLSKHIFKNLIKMKLKSTKFSLHEQRDYVLCSLINGMFHSVFTSYNTEPCNLAQGKPVTCCVMLVSTFALLTHLHFLSSI